MVKNLKPDIVLLDIEMPEMSGLEVMEHLSLMSRAKVIIISSVAPPWLASSRPTSSCHAPPRLASPRLASSRLTSP